MHRLRKMNLPKRQNGCREITHRRYLHQQTERCIKWEADCKSSAKRPSFSTLVSGQHQNLNLVSLCQAKYWRELKLLQGWGCGWLFPVEDVRRSYREVSAWAPRSYRGTSFEGEWKMISSKALFFVVFIMADYYIKIMDGHFFASFESNCAINCFLCFNLFFQWLFHYKNKFKLYHDV